MQKKHLQHGLPYLVNKHGIDAVMFWNKEKESFFCSKFLTGAAFKFNDFQKIENYLLIKAKQQPYEI